MISFTDEQIDRAYNAAPSSVRAFIESGALSGAVIAIGKTRNLHVDTVGIVAEHARNILIGILSPSQFIEELKGAGLPESVANGVLQDLNERAFKPLHEQVRSGEGAPDTKEKLTPASTPPPVSLAGPRPLKPSAPPAPPPAPVSVVPQTPPPAVIAPPPPTPKIPEPPLMPAPPPPPPPMPSVPAHPPMRTMAHDIEEMKEGKEPTPFIPPPQPPATKSPPAPIQPPAPPLSRQSSAANIPSHEEVASTLKEYGIDPYREPLE